MFFATKERGPCNAKGEDHLCAGALGSPQLPLLSGIGPRPSLSSWGIPLSHHLPYVGQFLYENPRNGISIVPPIPLEHSLIQVVGITNSGTGAYLEATSNLIPFVSPARSLFIRNPASPLYLTVATLMEKITGPLSVHSGCHLQMSGLTQLYGSTTLVIRVMYVERCVNGTCKIGDVLRSRSMEDFQFREWFVWGPRLKIRGACIAR